jgi:hypothetical protein
MSRDRDYQKERRDRFRSQGKRPVEVWLPVDMLFRVRIAQSMRGERNVNAVIEDAVQQWLDLHSVPEIRL